MIKCLISVYFLVCCLYVHIGDYHVALADVQLKLSNDGPIILDSYITFFAILKGDIPEGDYEYVFEDNTQTPNASHVVTAGKSANLTLFVSSKVYRDSYYTMKVTVFKKIFNIIPEKIVSGKMTFRLTEGINGVVSILNQDNPDYIPAGVPLTFKFQVHDPSHSFINSSFVYIWKFNQSTFFNLKDNVTYNVSTEGKLLVSLSIFAQMVIQNTTTIKSGSVDQTYSALKPVSNLMVQGSVWMKRGEVMNLDISCNGTPIFRYCARVFVDNSTDPCNGQDPVSSTQCSFRIMHFFRTAGTYRVGLLIKNNLNMLNKSIDVQIYDVDKRPQLSTIIFPIASCCIGIVIIVVGVAYHLQQRRTYTIEVADFDFQVPVMLIEKSFFARVKESIQDAIDNYRQGRSPQYKMVVNGSSRTTPIPSRYVS